METVAFAGPGARGSRTAMNLDAARIVQAARRSESGRRDTAAPFVRAAGEKPRP